jgi:hypothetical protein
MKKRVSRFVESGLWLTGKEGSWNSVFILAILVLITQSVLLFSFKRFPEVGDGTTLVRGLHAFLAALLVVLFPYLRKRGSSLQAALCFVVIIAPFYLMIWINHVTYSQLQIPWTPMAGPKLLFLTLAVLVPGHYRVNALLMLAAAAESIALWALLDFPVDQLRRLPPEPWMTLFFGVFSALLLVFRYRDERVIRQLALSRVQAELLEGQARIFLSVRDLSNSPLQVLLISMQLLRKNSREQHPELDTMNRAVERLARVNKVLSRFEYQLRWEGDDLMTEEQILEWADKMEARVKAENKAD